MTPHPHPISSRAMSHTGLTRGARRAAFAVAAAVAAAGAPFVAHGLNESPASAAPTAIPASARPNVDVLTASGVDATGATWSVTSADLEPAERVDPPDRDPAVDPALVVLVDTYTWGERSTRVEQLQAVVGATVDGWYGGATRQAHVSALVGLGFPTHTVPAPALPPGPSAEAWAALRDCESNGNYAITNPSGTYRGAYQFDRSTWDSVASRHAPGLVGVDPAAAAPADQDAMAYALYGERGARPWPHCGRHLG
jgi:hypothetical protein